MNKRKIFFRADASATIGYGHFIRSLALADMLKDDFDCFFYTQTPSDYQKDEVRKVCNLISLPSDDSKFDVFLDVLHGDEIVVLDNYFFTSGYQEKIKEKGCKLVCIDDIHNQYFHADAVINHCIDNPVCYSSNADTAFFMGARWALLRKPFLTSINGYHNENEWLIAFGGSDSNNLTLKYLDYLISHGIKKVSLLLGDGYSHFNELEKYNDIQIYKNLTADQVAALMNNVGNIICSASTVCYEAIACGCRVFAGYYIDNQIDFYHSLAKRNLICPLGDLINDVPLIDFEYTKMPVDISFNEIVYRYKLLFKALSVQIVAYQNLTDRQSHEVWKCRNNEDIRKWMVNQESFDYQSHLSFIENLKNRNDKQYFAFFEGDNFLGSYNFINILDDTSAERGLFINPGYQNRNAASMMETFLDGIILKRGVKTLFAEVLKFNTKSIHYHLKMHYTFFREDENFYYLKREL